MDTDISLDCILHMQFSQMRMGWRRRLLSEKDLFIGRSTVAMILSDNIFAGHGLNLAKGERFDVYQLWRIGYGRYS